MAIAGSEGFSQLLRSFRQAAGLTQEELAERAGLSVRGIGDLERGINRAPYLNTIARLSDALALSDDDRAALEQSVSRRRGPAAPARRAAGALPAQVTSLVGREREEAAIVHLLRWEGLRLVTLTGPGGVGKTRLALQVAAVVEGDFAGDVAFVPLASVIDAELVALAIASTFGIRERAGETLAQSLEAYLQDRESLLVLDNFEHVTAAAPLVASLLAASPRLKILVTSREVLRLRGEQTVTVGPLPAPPINQRAIRPADLEQYASVMLFLQRAQAVAPAFHLTEGNATAIAGICARLEGLPLAIELAAAWIRVVSPEALLQRLEPRLELLTGGSPESLPRQQTMRATIASSHDLLDEEEQTLFRRLAVFHDGCDLTAAAAVCFPSGQSERGALDRLIPLVDKSLLASEAGTNGEPRFTMLETVREYAREQLALQGEESTYFCRLAEYWVALAAQAEPELRGVAQGSWLELLEREHRGIQAVLAWCHDSGEAELGLKIAAAIWWFWYAHGHLAVGLRWLTLLLGGHVSEQSAADAEVRARALRGAGILAAEQSDYDRADELTRESLELSRGLGDTSSVAGSLTVLGNIAKYRGDYEQATVLYEEALSLFRGLEQTRSVAVTLNNLGSVAKEVGDYERARELYEQSLVLKRQLEDERGVASLLNNLAMVIHAQGGLSYAAELAGDSLRMLRGLEDKDIARVLDTLGRIRLDQGDAIGALDLYQEGLTVSQRAGERELVAFCLEGIGRVRAMEEADYEAVRLYSAAASLREEVGAPLSPSEAIQHARHLAASRRRLGEQEYIAGWAEGASRPLETVLAGVVWEAERR